MYMLILPSIFYLYQFGFKVSMINLQLSTSGLGYNYLKHLRVFWGQAISLPLLLIDVAIDEKKYRIIAHTHTHSTIKRLNKSSDQRSNIILVIGESANPKRLSIYNTTLKTTPNVKNLCNNHFLYAFEKVHTQASNTRLAVPMLISFFSPINKNSLFNFKNIIEMAHEAGYNSYWIGSQELSTEWDKPYGFLARYSHVLASSDIYNNTKFKIITSKDDSLIPAIDFYFSEKKSKNFYIIHLFGSHMAYDTNVDSDDIIALQNSDAYDRSIHHTDRILNTILEKANKLLVDYEFIYVSDHGEIINKGHGFSTDNNEMYLVPLIMKRSRYCGILESFRRKNDWLSSSIIKYIILQMMGYEINKDDLTQEIIMSNKIFDENENMVEFENLKDMSIYSLQKQ